MKSASHKSLIFHWSGRPDLNWGLPAPKAVGRLKKCIHNYLKLLRICQATLFHPVCAWCAWCV